MKKLRKNDDVMNALRQGTVFKEATYRFPKSYSNNDDRVPTMTEDVKVFMLIAPNKGICAQEDRDFVEKIEVFYNDKDGIRLATERGKKGAVTEYTRMNEGAICIVVTKNFKGLFTSKKVLNCIMALNAAYAYYTMNGVGRSHFEKSNIDANVCKFLVLFMKFKPNVIKAALELCAKRHIEAMFKYSKELYKTSKKDNYRRDVDDINDGCIDTDDDDDDADYGDSKSKNVKETTSQDGQNFTTT